MPLVFVMVIAMARVETHARLRALWACDRCWAVYVRMRICACEDGAREACSSGCHE